MSLLGTRLSVASLVTLTLTSCAPPTPTVAPLSIPPVGGKERGAFHQELAHLVSVLCPLSPPRPMPRVQRLPRERFRVHPSCRRQRWHAVWPLASRGDAGSQSHLIGPFPTPCNGWNSCRLLTRRGGHQPAGRRPPGHGGRYPLWQADHLRICRSVV